MMRILLLAALVMARTAYAGPADTDIRVWAHRDLLRNRCDLTINVENHQPIMIDRLVATVEIVSTYGSRSLSTLYFHLIEPGRNRAEPAWADGDCADPNEAAKILWSKNKGPVGHSAWVRVMSIESCVIGGVEAPNCAGALHGTWPMPGGDSAGILPVMVDLVRR